MRSSLVWLLLLSSLLPFRPVDAQALLSETAPRVRIIRQVFDRLTYVFASSRPQPQLAVIAQSPRKTPVIVQYVPGNRPLVRMDEEVYGLCRALGRDSLNALAVLLGHELAHHYEKHDWSVAFGIGSTGQPVDPEQTRRLEAEADFYGCFYGELAGYATGAVFPRILDRIYDHYHLSDRLPSYLPRTERKQIYAQKQAEAFDLAGVFRAGQVLYLLKEYEAAASCFTLLTNRFPSREMFSNLSASRLQQALALNVKADFAYPVELDARSRLATTTRAPATDDRRRDVLLQQARRDAAKAREMDPAYSPAYVNLACAYVLLGNPNAAIGVINELPAPSGDAYTIRAIALYQDGQRPRAGAEFERANERGGSFADYNLNLYRQLERPLTASLSQWIQNWFTSQPAPASGQRTGVFGRPAPGVGAASGGKPVLVSEQPYVRVTTAGEQSQTTGIIQTALKTYAVTRNPSVAGLRAALSSQALTARFGLPTYQSPGEGGRFWVYRDLGLIVAVDGQNRVTHWFIYGVTV